MALRDQKTNTTSGGGTTPTSSAIARLPVFWEVAEVTPKTEMEKWWDLFIVAANAKHSILVPELMRTVTEARPRQDALINNPE